MSQENSALAKLFETNRKQKITIVVLSIFIGALVIINIVRGAEVRTLRGIVNRRVDAVVINDSINQGYRICLEALVHDLSKRVELKESKKVGKKNEKLQ